MRRQALRERPDMDTTYVEPHDHTKWGYGHGDRVNEMIRMAKSISGAHTVADLSCGNGAVALASGASRVILGDYAPGHEITGLLEETLKLLHPVDLYVCGETVEHLEDPDLVLRLIRPITNNLILSTPCAAWDENNDQHLWAWDEEWLDSMLINAGFEIQEKTFVDSLKYGEPYNYYVARCT